MTFLKSESYKKGILFSIALNVFAKGFGFVNSLIVAYFFGAHAATDVYFYCFVTASLFVGFIGALDNSVLIPEAMRIREHEGEKKANGFLNFFLYLYAAIVLVILLLLSINPVGFLSPASNFNTSVLVENKGLVFWFLPICFLMLITNYLTNILSSYKFFTIPIIAGIINNFFSIVFLVIFHKSFEVKSMALGLSTGYLVNITILIWLMKRLLNWHFKWTRISIDSKLKRNITYALSGNISSFFSGYAPFYFMSNFNPGMVTMYNYARNLCEMPNQMIATQFSSVSGIKFNEVSARNDSGKLNELFIQSTGVLIFIMTPLCSILFLFSGEIISILYHRGAFDSKAVNQTAFILKYLSFTGIYFVLNTMVSRLFMATQKLKESFWYQIYMNILLIIILGTASFSFGIAGFVAGMFIYQVCVIISMYWLVKRHLPYIGYMKILKAVVVNVIVNGALVVLFSLLMSKSILTPVMTALVIGLYMLCILLINQGFGVNKIFKEYATFYARRFMALVFPSYYRSKA